LEAPFPPTTNRAASLTLWMARQLHFDVAQTLKRYVAAGSKVNSKLGWLPENPRNVTVPLTWYHEWTGSNKASESTVRVGVPEDDDANVWVWVNDVVVSVA